MLLLESGIFAQHTTLTTDTSMTPVGFEPTISADERPQTYVLDGARPLGPANITSYVHFIIFGRRFIPCSYIRFIFFSFGVDVMAVLPFNGADEDSAADVLY